MFVNSSKTGSTFGGKAAGVYPICLLEPALALAVEENVKVGNGDGV